MKDIFKPLAKFIAPKGDPPTPYHFTLEVSKSLYHILDGTVGRRRLPPYTVAMVAPLRAIAYFSWERTAQMFLARRVYPTYFDFLSYSHVPAGWGALGAMLKALEEPGRNYKKDVYTAVPDIRRRNSILFPYLREATRLNYRSVLVLPIFEGGEPTQSALLGACVFYLRDEASLPERAQVKDRLQAFALAMSRAVSRHEQRITDLERSKNWHLDLHLGENYCAELHLSIHPDGRAEILDEIADEIVRSLTGHDLYCIPAPDSQDGERKMRMIMIAARDGMERKLVRKLVLSAVGHACAMADGNPYISSRLNDGSA